MFKRIFSKNTTIPVLRLSGIISSQSGLTGSGLAINNLEKLIDLKIISKKSSVSFGDDYQILFTAKPSKFRIISKISKLLGVKISKIGKICASSQKSQIIDENNNKIAFKNKGYFHKF